MSVELGRTAVGAGRAARSDGAFARARPAWHELGAHAEYFFQTPEWIELLAGRVERDVVWGVVLDGERPAAVAVLRSTLRRAGHIRLDVLSQVRIGESQLPYADGLLDPDAYGGRPLRDLVDACGPWHVLWLTGLRASSPWLALAGEEVLVREEPDGGVGVLDTRVALERCWAAVPRHMRHSIHNARHRIDARGGARIEVASGDDVAVAYQRHVELEACGWKGRAGTSLAERSFDRELLREYLAVEPSAQVRTLWIGGRLAATQVATCVAGTLFLRRIAYAEEYAKCSPSNVLLADLIESCCADPGIERIDCLAWQPWIPRWGMTREPTYSLVAFNQRTVRGTAARASRGGWERLRARQDRRSHQLRRPSHGAAADASGARTPARQPRRRRGPRSRPDSAGR
jgi:CelD/BcsL family acetyltransferase involved in cellulose biosynthesis